MAQHTITLTLSPDHLTIIQAAPNPLDPVADNDTVTWRFVDQDPGTGTERPVEGLRVEFQAFLPNSHLPPLVAVHPFTQFGTGSGSTLGAFTVSTSARAGLYLYAVIDSVGNVVKWLPSIPLFRVGSFVASFGGIVKPMGPP
jgi:hypothetical protein